MLSLRSPSLTVFSPSFPLCLTKASESPSRASAGPVVLAVAVAVPVCILSLTAVLVACTCQSRRCTRGRAKQPNVEEPLSECNLVSSRKTLKDLIYDMTTSGSGSGTWGLRICPACCLHRGCLCFATNIQSRCPWWKRHMCHLACRDVKNLAYWARGTYWWGS